MSSQALEKFKERLHGLLMNESEAYREEVSNLQTHTFSLNLKILEKEILQQVQTKPYNGAPVPEAVKARIKTGAKEIFDEYTRRLKKTRDYNIANYKSTPANLTATVISKGKLSRRKAGGIDQVLSQDVFSFIRGIKKEVQKKLVADLNALIESNKKEGQEVEKISTGAFLDITHQPGTAVSTQREIAATQMLNSLAENSGDVARAKALIAGAGLDLTVLKPHPEEILVSIGGTTQNRGPDAQKETEIFAEVRKDITKVLESLPEAELIEMAGSDSALSFKRKKILKALKFTGKNITTKNFEDTKIKYSKGKAKKKSKPKVNALSFTEPFEFDFKKGRSSTTKKGAFKLAALINNKLPATVAKNMGPPGLENVSGRFAGSVRGTDVAQTPKGFPSIGYTYQKNPYQVFEPGQGIAPWATAERDPRKVIDASIREIAATLLQGRFFTRRT